MLDISVIPYSDIIKFLTMNNQYVPQTKQHLYEHVLYLIGTGQASMAPPSISDWIISYNLLLQNIKISPYKTSYILTSSDASLKDLSNKLLIGEIDRERIIRILGYLNILDNDMSIFETLPIDVCNILFTNCDSKSLLSLYTTSKSLGKIYPITRIAEILSSRLNLNLQDCNLDDLKYYISKEYMMFILNILARSYHTGYGFNSQSRLYRKFDKNFNNLDKQMRKSN